MKIELDHWFVLDNELTIALLRFYVEIKRISDNQFRLRAVDINGNKLFLEFKNLETAMYFTEYYINDCNTIEEIQDIYNNVYNDNMLKKMCK